LTHTIRGFAAIAFLLLACVTIASAQSGSVYLAGGTAIDSSAGPVDPLGAGITLEAPRMGGFLETIGGDFIFFHHLGIGAETSFRKGRSAYAYLEYRPSFYDFNVVYQPLTIARRLTPEIQAGYGEADLNFYYTPQICYKLPQGCGPATGEALSVSDPQVHLAGGLRFYVYKGLFVRPQMDVRRVQNNFSSYFGSSWVSEYSVALGYTLHVNRKRTAQK
jgi:hypothetical protein